MNLVNTNRLSIFFVALAGAVSCTSAKDGADKEATDPQCTAAASGCSAAGSTASALRAAPFALDRFFSKLSRDCAKATGRGLDGVDFTCSCDDGSEAFARAAVFVPGEGCRAAALPEGSCTASPTGFSSALANSGYSGLQACLYSAGGFAGSYPASTRARVLLPDPGSPDAAAQTSALAAWADQQFGVRRQGLPGVWPSASLSGDELYLQIGKPSPQAFDKGIALALNASLSPEGDSSAGYGLVLVEPDPSELDFVLGIRAADPRRLVRLTPAPSEGGPDASARRDAHEAVRALSTERTGGLDFRAGHMVSGDAEAGCAGMCRVFTAETPLRGGARAFRERIYSFGSIARDALWVFRNDELSALVLLTPAGTPGLILTFRTTVKADRVESVLRAYDRSWNVLGPEKTSRFDVPFSARQTFTRTAEDGPSSGNVLTCEYRFREALSEPDLKDDFSIGPYPAHYDNTGRLDRGSLLGWAKNPSGSARYYARETEDALSGVWATPGPGSRPDLHAARVLRVLKGQAAAFGKRFGLVPMNYATCFEEADAWLPAVRGCVDGQCRKPLARVINVSAGDWEMTRAACGDTAGFTVDQKAPDMVWVLGAGNGGNSFRGRDTPRLGCPATLGGRKNVLVVSALDGDSLWSGSDYGVRYADVAADGREGNEVGTSFSAPRVAAVAATLAQDHPGLAPDAIRLAILASARPVASLRDAVRSGGSLDGRVAREVGACLAHEADAQAAETVSRCLAGSSYEGDVEDKIGLLQERGAFSGGGS